LLGFVQMVDRTADRPAFARPRLCAQRFGDGLHLHLTGSGRAEAENGAAAHWGPPCRRSRLRFGPDRAAGWGSGAAGGLTTRQSERAIAESFTARSAEKESATLLGATVSIILVGRENLADDRSNKGFHRLEQTHARIQSVDKIENKIAPQGRAEKLST